MLSECADTWRWPLELRQHRCRLLVRQCSLSWPRAIYLILCMQTEHLARLLCLCLVACLILRALRLVDTALASWEVERR